MPASKDEQDGLGDEVYQPDGDDREVSDEVDRDNVLDERDSDDVMEEGYSPPEKPLGTTKVGTTAGEQAQGETLDEPGDPDPVGDRRAGRLVAPGEGAHPDEEKDMLASDVGVDGGAVGAEEAAVHVVDPEDRP